MSNQNRFMLKQGLILGLLSIALGVIGYHLQLNNIGWFQAVSVLLPAAYIAFMLFNYRKGLAGEKMGFDRAFRMGFIPLMIGSIFSAVFIFCYLNYLQPELLEKQMELMNQKMIDSGKSEEEIQSLVNSFKLGFTNFWWFLGTMVLASAIYSAITALILAIILRRNVAENSAGGE